MQRSIPEQIEHLQNTISDLKEKLTDLQPRLSKEPQDILINDTPLELIPHYEKQIKQLTAQLHQTLKLLPEIKQKEEGYTQALQLLNTQLQTQNQQQVGQIEALLAKLTQYQTVVSLLQQENKKLRETLYDFNTQTDPNEVINNINEAIENTTFLKLLRTPKKLRTKILTLKKFFAIALPCDEKPIQIPESFTITNTNTKKLLCVIAKLKSISEIVFVQRAKSLGLQQKDQILKPKYAQLQEHVEKQIEKLFDCISEQNRTLFDNNDFQKAIQQNVEASVKKLGFKP